MKNKEAEPNKRDKDLKEEKETKKLDKDEKNDKTTLDAKVESNSTHAHSSSKDLIEKLAKYKDEIKELKQKVEELEQRADDAHNSLLLARADAENYKKRADKDSALARDFANKAIVTDLLPALDSLDSALATLSDEKTKEGLDLVRASIMQALAKHGLEKIIVSIGDDFDPLLHEACLFEEGDGKSEGEKVALELSAGYRLNGKVLRPTKVKVIK